MKKQYYIPALILAIIAIIIALFSYHNVWLGDDINYAFDFREGHRDEIVSSLPQILQSMNTHYMISNGRHIAHIMVQFFCGIWGHLAFALANAVIYICFIIVLCKLCRVKISNTKGFITVVLLALTTFQTKMVPSCQIGYIWTFTLGMLYILLFFSDKRKSDKWWQILLFSLFALITGNGNESLTIGISGALIIYWIQNMRKMTISQYAMMICFGLGTLAICLSPAAHSRAAASIDGGIVKIYNSLSSFFLSSKSTFIMLIIVLWYKYHHKLSFKQIYNDNSFFFNIWIIMMLFNAVIGFGSNRQIFGAELAAIIISVRLLKDHSFNYLWLSIFTIYLIYLYAVQIDFMYRSRTIYDEIERQYIESTDGKVYIDVDNDNHIPPSMNFSSPIPIYGTGGDYYDYEYTQLEKWLKTQHLGENDLRVIPTIMKGYKYTDGNNEIISLKQSDLYFIIQSKENPQVPCVSRQINKPFLKTTYDPAVIDMDQYIVCEGDNWKARYVDLNDYTVLRLSENKISFK